MKYSLLLFFVFFSMNAIGQTYPAAFDLSSGDYVLDNWLEDSPAGTYPANMTLHTFPKTDPLDDAEPNGNWALAYNLTSKSRIMGGNENGIIFYNTSTSNEGGGFIGEALLAINTENCSAIKLKYTARLISSGERDYGLKLQYRIGSSGEFVDFSDADFHSNQGLDSLNYDFVLPNVLENQFRIELCWKYYFLNENNSGSRPQIALDDVYIGEQKSKVNNHPLNSYISNNVLFISEDDKIKNIEIYNINGNRIANFEITALNYIDLLEYKKYNIIYLVFKKAEEIRIISHNFKFSSN